MSRPSFVDGLVELDTKATRERLGQVLAVVKARAIELGGAHEQALVDRIASVDCRLRDAARKAIRDLDAALAAYETPPPVDAVADITARIDADQPPPAAAPSRLRLPVRPQVPLRRPA